MTTQTTLTTSDTLTDSAISEGENSHQESVISAALAHQITQLSADAWEQLGVSQEFHQRLLTSYFSELLSAHDLVETHEERREDEGDRLTLSLERALKLNALNLRVMRDLEGSVKRLFELTVSHHVELLVAGEWLNLHEDTSHDNEVTLNLQRAQALRQQISLNAEGEVVISQESRPLVEEVEASAEERDVNSPEIEEVVDSSKASAKPEYVDPLDHISRAIESPFTIRRLDQILVYLDGLVLPREQVGELLKIPSADRDIVFDAMNRLGLTHQENEYIKLDFLGLRIARLTREERLKQLAVIASRLRVEAKMKAR